MTSFKNSNSPIKDGTFLIEENTVLPNPSPQDSQSIGNGWVRITSNPAFEKKLAAPGWTFFYRAGTMRENVYGFDRPGMLQTAVKRLLATAALQKCNCVEIDHITMRSTFGIPCVSVSAHSRHIQQEYAISKEKTSAAKV